MMVFVSLHILLLVMLESFKDKLSSNLINSLRICFYGCYLLCFFSIIPQSLSDFIVINYVDIYWIRLLTFFVLGSSLLLIRKNNYLNYKIDFIYFGTITFIAAKGVLLFTISWLAMTLFLFIWIFSEKQSPPKDFKVFFSILVSLIIFLMFFSFGSSSLIYFSNSTTIFILLEAFTIFLLMTYMLFNLNYLWSFIQKYKSRLESILIFFIFYITIVFYKLTIILSYILDKLRDSDMTLYSTILLLFCVFHIFLSILTLGNRHTLLAPFSLFNIMIIIPIVLTISFLNSSFSHYLFLYYLYLGCLMVARLLLNETKPYYWLLIVMGGFLIAPLLPLLITFTAYIEDLDVIEISLKWAPLSVLSMALVFAFISLHYLLKLELFDRIEQVYEI